MLSNVGYICKHSIHHCIISKQNKTANENNKILTVLHFHVTFCRQRHPLLTIFYQHSGTVDIFINTAHHVIQEAVHYLDAHFITKGKMSKNM